MIVIAAPRTRVRRSIDPRRLLEDCAFRYGQTYDAYLATEDDRQQFWASGRQGVVSYVRVGRYLHVGGGLLAAPQHKANLLAEFLDFARQRGYRVSFYNLLPDDLPLFRRHGFQTTKWGEEAMIDLGRATWQGKAFEWVRRQSNYCQRKGLVVCEYRPDELSEMEDARLLQEMEAIANEPLQSRPQRSDVRFVEGAFNPRNLGRKRLFLARSLDGRGRIEGLLVCNPGQDGNLWAFELYRHRKNSIRGTVAFLMHQVMQLLQDEGVEQVSMCLIPAQGCSQPREGDSRLTRWGLSIGSRYFGFLFDIVGTAYFKSRFRPSYEDRYIGVWPRQTLGSAWTFIRVLGVLDLDYPKICRLVARGCRRTLGKLLQLDDSSSPSA